MRLLFWGLKFSSLHIISIFDRAALSVLSIILIIDLKKIHALLPCFGVLLFGYLLFSTLWASRIWEQAFLNSGNFLAMIYLTIASS